MKNFAKLVAAAAIATVWLPSQAQDTRRIDQREANQQKRIEQGEELAEFENAFTDELINSGQFKPELLNRFDEIVLFRPLKPDELARPSV